MGERVYKASELKLPCTIEYTRHRDNRGSLISRKTIIQVKNRNLLTECGDWLWWQTCSECDVRKFWDGQKWAYRKPRPLAKVS